MNINFDNYNLNSLDISKKIQDEIYNYKTTENEYNNIIESNKIVSYKNMKKELDKYSTDKKKLIDEGIINQTESLKKKDIDKINNIKTKLISWKMYRRNMNKNDMINSYKEYLNKFNKLKNLGIVYNNEDYSYNNLKKEYLEYLKLKAKIKNLGFDINNNVKYEELYQYDNEYNNYVSIFKDWCIQDLLKKNNNIKFLRKYNPNIILKDLSLKKLDCNQKRNIYNNYIIINNLEYKYNLINEKIYLLIGNYINNDIKLELKEKTNQIKIKKIYDYYKTLKKIYYIHNFIKYFLYNYDPYRYENILINIKNKKKEINNKYKIIINHDLYNQINNKLKTQWFYDYKKIKHNLIDLIKKNWKNDNDQSQLELLIINKEIVEHFSNESNQLTEILIFGLIYFILLHLDISLLKKSIIALFIYYFYNLN